jgi:PAS domain S-box-containing protein
MNKSTTTNQPNEQPNEPVGRENELAVEDINFRQLAETIPHLVWSARADGVPDYYNTRFLEFLGKPREETYGWTWTETLHPDDRQRSIHNWLVSFTSGADYCEEYRLRRASDGHYLWYEGHATPLRDADGNVVRWFGTCSEIEGRKRAEERLRSSESKLRSLVENVSDCLWEVDPQGRFTYLNPNFQDYTGYLPGEFLGRNSFALIPEEERDQLWRQMLAGKSLNCADLIRNTLDRVRCARYKPTSSLQGFSGVNSPGFVADNKAQN